MIARLLDRLLGPRTWMVVLDTGTYFAAAQPADPRDIVVRTGLREAAAHRLARKLRHRAENTPRNIL